MHVILLLFMISQVESLSMSKLKIVVLHGKNGNGRLFEHILRPLADKLGTKYFEWYFPNAPFLRESTSQNDKTLRYEWWRLPTDTRSYTALEYYGVNESIKLVENLSPNILIGHSQGAILSSILLARAIEGSSQCPLKAGILSGSAWPNPYSTLMNHVHNISRSSHHKSTSMSSITSTTDSITSNNKNHMNHNMDIQELQNHKLNERYIDKSSLKILHTLCLDDPINPATSGLQTAQIFEYYDNHILYHDEGHHICMQEHFLETYCTLLNSCLET